jgi:AcrR family transcriptional regulator
MTAAESADVDPGRRRGRRPAGEDARGAIVAAARTEFAARGYDGTTLRGIARAAGVDPRLVHHYFEGKEDVFVAALALPVRPADLIGRLSSGPADELGERLVRFFFGAWDHPDGREVLVGLLRSVVASQDAATMLKQFIAQNVLARIAASSRQDDPELRAALAASQMVGTALLRYVVQVEPLASADVEDLVPMLAPTIQRYLAG